MKSIISGIGLVIAMLSTTGCEQSGACEYPADKVQAEAACQELTAKTCKSGKTPPIFHAGQKCAELGFSRKCAGRTYLWCKQ